MVGGVRFAGLAELVAALGQEIHVTQWVVVDQSRIDAFARATGDFQWIHVDVGRAKLSPFGGTIAHGFLTLALLGGFYEPFLEHALPFCDMGLNYGLNKVRFTSPVRSGSKVRGRFVLSGVGQVRDGLELTCTVTIEIEDQPRPALVAESVVRRLFRRPGT